MTDGTRIPVGQRDQATVYFAAGEPVPVAPGGSLPFRVWPFIRVTSAVTPTAW